MGSIRTQLRLQANLQIELGLREREGVVGLQFLPWLRIHRAHL